MRCGQGGRDSGEGIGCQLIFHNIMQVDILLVLATTYRMVD